MKPILIDYKRKRTIYFAALAIICFSFSQGVAGQKRPAMAKIEKATNEVNAKISGTVTDSITKQGAAGVKVSLFFGYEEVCTAYSDSTGNFVLNVDSISSYSFQTLRLVFQSGNHSSLEKIINGSMIPKLVEVELDPIQPKKEYIGYKVTYVRTNLKENGEVLYQEDIRRMPRK